MSPKPDSTMQDPRLAPKAGDRWRYDEGHGPRFLHIVSTDPAEIAQRFPTLPSRPDFLLANGAGAYQAYFERVLALPGTVYSPLGSEPDDFACAECGGTFNPRYWLTGKEYAARRLCLDDAHWADALDGVHKGERLVIGGAVYSLGDEGQRGDKSGRGFGGDRHVIHTTDGRRIVSTNLWHNGFVPVAWRARLPDNATFAPAGVPA